MVLTNNNLVLNKIFPFTHKYFKILKILKVYFLNFILSLCCHDAFLHLPPQLLKFYCSLRHAFLIPDFLDSLDLLCLKSSLTPSLCHHYYPFHPTYFSPLLTGIFLNLIVPSLFSLITLDYNLPSHSVSHLTGPYYFFGIVGLQKKVVLFGFLPEISLG